MFDCVGGAKRRHVFSIFFEGLIWLLLLAVFAQSTKWISGAQARPRRGVFFMRKKFQQREHTVDGNQKSGKLTG